MAEMADISYALKMLADRRPRYQKYRRYAEGNQDMRYASYAFRSIFGDLFKHMSYNKCGRVIDAFTDRLIVIGWENPASDSTDEDQVESEAMRIWNANRLGNVQFEFLSEALQEGDSYAIVWPDNEDDPKTPVIAPNTAENVIAFFDENDPSRVDFAVKTWRIERGPDAGKVRVNVYEPDRITRLITRSKPQSGTVEKADTLGAFDSDAFDSETANPWGITPVVPFRNNARTGLPGISELRDVLTLQDGLNKAIIDMLVGAEFQAYNQRVVIGMEPDSDAPPLKLGTSRLLELPPNSSIAEWAAADMNQFLNMQDSWEFKIARTTAVPIHWLTQSGGASNASGEALKTAEAPFVRKVQKMQQTFGESWSQVMHLALIQTGMAPEMAREVAPIWAPAESRSDQEFWSIANQRIASGVSPEVIWAEWGYTPEEIANIKTLNDEAAAKRLDQTMTALDRGQLETGL